MQLVFHQVCHLCKAVTVLFVISVNRAGTRFHSAYSHGHILCSCCLFMSLIEFNTLHIIETSKF